MAYDDEDDDRDGPDSIDRDDGDGDVLDPCPACGKLMYDDAERCPHCGHYVADPLTERVNSLWLIVTAAVCLALVLLLLLC